MFRQSDGCIESAYALQYGSEITEAEYIAAEINRIKAEAAERVQGIKERAKEIEITRGVTLVKPATIASLPPLITTDATNASRATNTMQVIDASDTFDPTVIKDWHLEPRYALDYPDESYLLERFVDKPVLECPF